MALMGTNHQIGTWVVQTSTFLHRNRTHDLRHGRFEPFDTCLQSEFIHDVHALILCADEDETHLEMFVLFTSPQRLNIRPLCY